MKQSREKLVKEKMKKRRMSNIKKSAQENKIRKLELLSKKKGTPFIKFKKDLDALSSNEAEANAAIQEIEAEENKRKLVKEKIKLDQLEFDPAPEGLDPEKCSKIQTDLKELFKKTQSINKEIKVVEKEEFDWNDFNKYFFPATPSYKPTSGQVLAKYLACATFENGDEKQSAIRILSTNSKGFVAAKNLLMKTIYAEEKSCVKLLKEMVDDLKVMTTEEVANKSYSFIFNQFYWTNRKYVPDDPHWQIIDLLNSTN